jgi:hypothetical protein
MGQLADQEVRDLTDRVLGIVSRIDSLEFGSASDLALRSMEFIYKEGPPVDIQTFITDDYYFGKIGKELYPANIPDILDIFDPKNQYTEVIFTGATSVGKTFSACICLAYMIYLLSCYTMPQRAIGGSTSTDIIFINMSVSARKAEGVVFTQVKNMLDRSPYFREKFRRDMSLSSSLIWRLYKDAESERTGSAIRFIPGTSDSLSALGENCYGGVIDECNFFRIISKSSKAIDGGEYDPAQTLYDTISRRLKGRYTIDGKSIGKLFLISSAMYPDDFISRRIAEAESDGTLGTTLKVIKKSEWEAKEGVIINGKKVHSEQTFRVEVGSSRKNSRILDSYDRKTNTVTSKDYLDIEGKVLHVPVDLYEHFYRDVDGAVRDFGGEVTRAISPFFPDMDLLYRCIDNELQHPYSKDETTLRDGVSFNYETLFKKDESGHWKPKRHPNKARYFHGDLGITQDCAGLAVVHIAGWKQTQLGSMTAGGIPAVEDRPIYETDLILRVTHPYKGETKISDIKSVLIMLRDYGMYFAKGSFDQFQSTGIRQELETEGFSVNKLSVVSDITPYMTLKDASYEGRLVIYRYRPFLEEMAALERRADKIEHPEPNGSKDTTDSVAGAVYQAFMAEVRASSKLINSRMPVKKTVNSTPQITLGSILTEFQSWVRKG